MIYWKVKFTDGKGNALISRQSIFQRRRSAILKATEKVGDNANGLNIISCRPALRIEIKF